MKTITLTDEAYQRLLAWKESPRHSFSKVVIDKVPKRGTFSDLIKAVHELPPLEESQAAVIEETIALGNDWQSQTDPWKP